MRMPVYKLKLVRDHWTTYPEPVFTRPQLAALFFHRLIGQAASEHAAAVFLDSQGVPLGATIIAVGSLLRVPMLGREVYKAAVVANACALIVSHNHPSGSARPSPEDLRVTSRLIEAGRLLGVLMLDHIIVTPGGNYLSMRDAGLLEPEKSTAGKD